MNHRRMALLLALIMLVPATARAAEPLKIMTFNIRFGTAEDGENHWDRRKENVAKTVRDFDPDIVGYQEMMPFQEVFMLDRVPGYALSGSVQAKDGRPQRAESAQIAWKDARFEKIDAGSFFLSQTPDAPGGDDWDSNQPRRVSWVALRETATGRTLHVFNTHFDHIGGRAKKHSARIMRERMNRIVGDGPLLVLGDFNTKAFSGEPYQILLNADSDDPPKLIDSFAAANPTPDWTGTFNKFEAGNARTARIDWILHTGHFDARRVTINRVTYDGRFPSDHYPVEATFAWPADGADVSAGG